MQTLGTIFSTLGQTYLRLNDPDLSRLYFRKSIELSSTLPDLRSLSGTLSSVSEIFFNAAQYDSAIIYARRGLAAANPDYKKQMMTAAQWLYKSFEKTGNADSTSRYFRLAVDLRDSIFSAEKTRSMQSLAFQEQLRKEEAEVKRKEALEERQTNIQYALIALGIIVVTGLFLLLSRSVITNTKIIDVFGIIVLLLVFEFLNLLLHPFLERITHHSPLLMLLSLVALAAILAPLHHKLEKWTTKKLVAKNKEIRLKAAQRTIERLKEHP